MAKISEMQAAIAAEQAQYNVALVDAQLSALGDAMTPAQALEAPGKALVESKFDKAAEKLETMEPPDLDPKEAKAAEEKMKQVAKEMGEVGLGQLGDGLIRDGRGAKRRQGAVSKGSRTLAKLVEGHSARRKIKEILDIEAAKLSECKGNCKSEKTARIRMPKKRDSPDRELGREHQRQRLRREDRVQGQPRAKGSHRKPRRRPVRSRDDPFRRGPAARRAAVSRAVPEIPQDLRGRARQRADPARPARDDPSLLRADPSPEPRRRSRGSGRREGVTAAVRPLTQRQNPVARQPYSSWSRPA